VAAARARSDDLELVDIDPYLPLPKLPGSDLPAEPPTPFDKIAPLYGPIIVKAPWLWGLTWHGTNNALGLAIYLNSLGNIVAGRIARAVERIDAAAIVSVHPLATHAMVRARQRLGRPELPLMSVITDLVDVHRWWADRAVDRYVVGSTVATAALERLGVDRARVAEFGIPLRREITVGRMAGADAKVQLGLDPELPLVLIMGGGDGAGRVPETARAIASIGADGGPKFQVIALAGRNQEALAALKSTKWPVPAWVYGIVPNIVQMMTAADVIVTKPGSLTVSEALAMGRPLVLGRPLPGQEAGNIGYVVRAGAGLHYRQPAEAAEAVGYLLRDPAARWEMGEAALRLAKPLATERTLDALQGMILRAEATQGVLAPATTRIEAHALAS
jgi:1,2-diacylglycerol 3-beta-galactosyltransferase